MSKKGLIKSCKLCKTKFYTFPYLVKVRFYCSRKCANKSNADHLSKIRIGKGNPMYGKLPHNYTGKNNQNRKYNVKYWKWRRKVFIRDNYTCQGCSIKFRRKYLTAHHIKPWAKFPKLRFVVSNGSTLCRPCHNKIDPQIKATQF